MSEITNDVLSGLGLNSYEATKKEPTDNSLGQEDFLKLMTTQLSNQDPLKPMENGEFLGEMAQFSTVTGIEELTVAFESLAQSFSQWQTLQGASLVGRDVLVPVENFELQSGEAVQGAISLPSSGTGVTVEVYDEAGQVIRTMDLGSKASGLHDFTWDGLTDAGTEAPSGTYEFRSRALLGEGSEALYTLVNGEVNSVALGGEDSGLVLQVQGIGNVDFNSVFRIGS
ncbi:flagellar hook assembly protein FlgD [Marichromatium bheemlicum]|uniref:Basal-body rod modification protein FlgD n=1 Tax=Marichromatium bheemlicum TaxID=365339 RepID=A0ABX1IAE9_9GAMM|nr:flagellar hook assembly protein FlgD [Marichromatium bheemlicum]NKN33177.1 flagellar hook assembly protein FlgD [Marichromatium bheemlicum]